MNTNKTSVFQRHGVRIYGAITVLFLVASWAFAMKAPMTVQTETAYPWIAVIGAIIFAMVTVRAYEVRQARDTGIYTKK